MTLTAMAASALALSACGNAEDKAKSDADRPNAEGLTAAEIAARATTEQVSMTPAEREEFRQGMVEMLDQTGENRAEGHIRVPGVEDQIVAMQPLQDHKFTVPMTAGKLYLIFAVCDGDCKVVDLTLLDSAGAEIKTDTDSGDFPVLDFTPTTSGSFSVRMTMTECDLAPCYAGARVYQQG
ncbi:MAG: hypothetical protein DCF29_06850 [Alphaproteobacteria bacterium]|nr:MAG: hypothetical protein DCF29_06850 [Alphaproteobacteria bacterium]